jgi:predicted AlkP superfamily phosphohydrolase/phosphomutase
MRQLGQEAVLAVGIDAAEPTLVRELIDRGELPVLAGLLERGEWALVESGADIGSAAVWPTFVTGTAPIEHGLYSQWAWRPETMAYTNLLEGFNPTPFWQALYENGERVGLLDVPFAPFGGISRGFELSQWGPHSSGLGGMRVSPPHAKELVENGERHPFTRLPDRPGLYVDPDNLRRLSASCVAGARLRGDLAVRLISETGPALAIVVFSEVHHAAHYLWPSVGGDHHPFANGQPPSAEDVTPSLVDLHREVDRQIGRIIESVAPDPAVMVFSLHGMRPGPGIPTILDPLLVALGFATPAGWRALSWRDRGLALFGAAKRRAPGSLRRVYHRTFSERAIRRLAQSTMVPPYDWSRTRAFSLPTDQHGYIRLNVAGREAMGAVPEREYRTTCDQLENALRVLTTGDGEPLVRDVVRTAQDGGPLPKRLPDLIVQWDDAAYARPVRMVVGSLAIEAHPIRTDRPAEHSPHGFCIVDPRLSDGAIADEVSGADLHRLLLPASADRMVAP